jgi:lipid-binding SYLF domain-containing protein
MRISKYITLLFGVWCFTSQLTYAKSETDNLFVNDPPALEEVNEQIATLTTTLETIIKDKVPTALMKQAKGIAVANAKKGGFVIAIQAGKGFMVVRNDQQWSNPAMITVSAASLGFQAGVEAKTVVLIFTQREAAEKVLQGNLKLGAGLNLSVGPLATDVSTDTVFDKEVYSYSDGMGLFAGLSLEGSSLTFDPLPNEGLYGKKVTAGEIFSGKATTDAVATKNLTKLLQEKSS